MTIRELIGGKLVVDNDSVKFILDKDEKQNFKPKKTFSRMTSFFKQLESEGKMLTHQIMQEVDPLYIFKKDSELTKNLDVVWEKGKLKLNDKKIKKAA